MAIKLRGKTAAQLAALDPVLYERQLCFETDTRKAKLGDGVSAWNALPYAISNRATEFIHSQTSPSSEWIINHNFGARPSIAVTNEGGDVVITEIVHASVNQARIYFASPTAGEARCL